MRFEGKIQIEAPQDEVWSFLADFLSAGECFPGLKTIEVTEPGKSFHLLLGLDLGPRQAPFDLTLDCTPDRPARARLQIRGRGDNSSVGASGQIFLNPTEVHRTEMIWSLSLSAHGLAAEHGQEVLELAFQRAAKGFAEAVKSRVESGASEEEAGVDVLLDRLG